jgi:hypothetical protein
MMMLLDGLGSRVEVKFVLYQFPRNPQHVNSLQCKDVPIFLDEFHECEFLFGIRTIPHMSNLRGLIWG